MSSLSSFSSLGSSQLSSGPLPEQPQEAIVINGTVTPDDTSAVYNVPGDQDIFTDYQIINRYEWDYSRYMLGVTSPEGFQGDSVAFVQLNNPTLLWICRWTAARFQLQPNFPNPVLTDPQWVLLDEQYEPAMVALAPDGVTPLYRISGTFVYGCRNPNTSSFSQMNYSQPPWIIAGSFDLTVGNAGAVNGLNDAVSTGGSAGVSASPGSP